jgi:CheY-like chemotaxis protein
MRVNEKLSAVPVILASALPEKTIRERCIDYQAFVRKPFKTERLMEEVSRLLDRPSSSSALS